MKLHPKADGETGRATNEIWLCKLDVFWLTILQGFANALAQPVVDIALPKFFQVSYGQSDCDVKY